MTSRPTDNARYRPLEDYALIGNTHSAALVSSGGSIDWCCLPHFDSPALFLRILDADVGGFFEIAPAGRYASSRRYAADSAILETTFSTDRGRIRVTDCMHVEDISTSRLGIDEHHCHRILRLVEGLEGDVTVAVRLRPTPDYARAQEDLTIRPGMIVGRADDGAFLLESPKRVAWQQDARGAMAARLRVKSGERVWFVLSYAEGGTPLDAIRGSDPDRMLDETRVFWQRWSSKCTYAGPYDALVRTSARVLKLLTFGPTGALVAAPTSSLPEEIGGVRNWDYRFAWLRDSALIIHALQSIGYHEAAMDFFRWLEEIPERDASELQIMYTLRGGRDLPERVLDHLEGYRGSSPVRIGNGAARQVQLDVYGHVLDAAWVCWRGGRPIRPKLWAVLRLLADEASRRWREPDQGIWEIRGPGAHFLSSKLMCWVALDRALALARDGGLKGNAASWAREREAIAKAIVEEGFDRRVSAFTQAFGSPELDASALLVPLVGFLPASDPRVVATADRIATALSSKGLVYRYLAPDGLSGSEATFAICTFWLVDNLALQGRIDEARRLFEHVTSYANDLGLLAEEIDPNARQLVGNYPQGFTHLALIQSALRIAKAERRARTGDRPSGAEASGERPRASRHAAR